MEPVQLVQASRGVVQPNAHVESARILAIGLDEAVGIAEPAEAEMVEVCRATRQVVDIVLVP